MEGERGEEKLAYAIHRKVATSVDIKITYHKCEPRIITRGEWNLEKGFRSGGREREGDLKKETSYPGYMQLQDEYNFMDDKHGNKIN